MKKTDYNYIMYAHVKSSSCVHLILKNCMHDLIQCTCTTER